MTFSSISNYFAKLKRPGPSACSESDPEKPQSSRTRESDLIQLKKWRQKRKTGQHEHARGAGQHSQRMDAQARNDDITKIQSGMQALSRTVSEKIEILEARVFEVESTNDQLQKEVGALTKEKQALEDTVKLQERKL